MKFNPNYPNDNNKGQRQLWHALKNSFERDEGVAYYRYPIFATSKRGRSEPDFLMIHRRFGIWIFESKGCQIGQIAAIEGHDWQMLNWYATSMSPVSQVEAQFFEVKRLFERDPELAKLKIPFEYRVVLPFVTESEWRMQGFSKHPSTNGIVWLEEDISRGTFRQKVQAASAAYMPKLSDDEWERVLGAFRGVVSDEPPRQPQQGAPVYCHSRAIHAVESRLRVLDEKQDRISQEVPEGPQRLRGLAGSGKTVLFARRVAQMHASNPDWEIAYVFWSRSLYQQIRDLVDKHFQRLTGEPPNWDKLHIWHAWGGKELTGFYRELALRWGCRYLDVTAAGNVVMDGESPYAAVCRILEKECQDRSPFLDAIVVDEGQDLPASFYRIAHHALRSPKRLYWAYDEAQGVDSLIVPNASEIFGRDQLGRPTVDLSGSYPSGMQKAHNLNRCYRTPRQILTTAHVINMGLLREGGPLQGVTSKEDWAALGYQVLEGDFSATSVKARATVILHRPDSSSGHPIDHPAFNAPLDKSKVLVVHESPSQAADVDFVSASIQRDLESGLRAEDIAVIALEPTKYLFKEIADSLRTLGIQVFALNNQNKDQFRQPGCITISTVRRAKGNEAYKVYALNLHMADDVEVANQEEAMIARNQVFVALTRTKLWCVAVGRPGPIMNELLYASASDGSIRFPAFNQASLKRSMGDTDSLQQELV
jgi:superfamily I DNA and RNA helicase